jgi:hypothetical protein
LDLLDEALEAVALCIAGCWRLQTSSPAAPRDTNILHGDHVKHIAACNNVLFESLHLAAQDYEGAVLHMATVVCELALFPY